MSVLVRELPAHDRPRERLLQHGVKALTDAELLAIHLGTGRAGRSALEVAQDLLREWGGLPGLARAHPAELARTTGIGPAKAARILAAFGLAHRATDEGPARVRLARSSDIAREAQRVIGTGRREQVLALVADGRLRLSRAEIIATGSATGCPMPVREVLATVLRHDGVAFAVAHNHPGGYPEPSAADRAATEALRAGAEAAGLRFLDHVVVTADDWRSAAA